MRLWEGVEKEGAQMGVNTLFVESDCVSAFDLCQIKAEAKKRSISRLYLGAGKVNVRLLCKEWAEICADMQVVVETTPDTIKHLPFLEKFHSVVVRNDMQIENYANIVPKIDNGTMVALYYQRIENSIKEVKGGMYSNTDKEIKL